MAKEHANWHMNSKLLKYEEDITPYKKNGTEAEFHTTYMPYEVVEQTGNCLLNAGINEMWDLITGAVSGNDHIYDNTYAILGVGSGTTEAAATDTTLEGGSTDWQGMEDGYPTSTAQKATFKGSWGAAEGNFAWNEWAVSQDTSDILLNHKVESLGTKSAGTWTLEVTITLS